MKSKNPSTWRLMGLCDRIMLFVILILEKHVILHNDCIYPREKNVNIHDGTVFIHTINKVPKTVPQCD